MERCIDHLNFTNGTCEDCGLEVDSYGNTEDQFDYCSFPDCGCDGSRLCDAKNGASDYSILGNVEGMWSGNSKEHVEARSGLVADLRFAADVAKRSKQ